MNEFPEQEQPTSDTLDFSDYEALQPQFHPRPSRHGSAFSTVASSDMAHIANVDRNDYSDEGWLRPRPRPSIAFCIGCCC